MRSNLHATRHGSVAALYVCAILSASACASTSDQIAAPTRPDSTATDTLVARSVVNPFAWVGVQHNAGLDLVRASLQARALGGQAACSDFLEVNFHSLLPKAFRNARMEAEVSTQLATAVSESPCQPSGMPTSARSRSSTFSGAALSLLDEVSARLANAASASDFAAQLGPVYAATFALPAGERDVVQATIGVAESSAQYWEANWGSFVAAVGAQYGPCLSSSPSWETCRENLHSRVAAGSAQATTGSTQFASVRSDCSYTSHPFRTLGEADFRGAISGAVGGMLSAGPLGGVVGALGGSMGASVSLGVFRGLQQFWCDLHQ
jgi:hypothetical protein